MTSARRIRMRVAAQQALEPRDLRIDRAAAIPQVVVAMPCSRMRSSPFIARSLPCVAPANAVRNSAIPRCRLTRTLPA